MKTTSKKIVKITRWNKSEKRYITHYYQKDGVNLCYLPSQSVSRYLANGYKLSIIDESI